MFQLCQREPAVKRSKSKADVSKKTLVKKSVSGPHIWQMYCPLCDDSQCNYGDRCGHREAVPGTYGYRRQDQRDFGTTGRTHEAEHAVGFASANRHNRFKRKSKAGRAYEDALPAYQEERQFHRQHIGTGNKSRMDASGFTSASYRDSQQTLVDNGDFATAVGLNQLVYSYLPGFQDSPMGTVADQSFFRMTNVPRVPSFDGNTYKSVALTEDDRLVMRASRLAARTGRWPKQTHINRLKRNLRHYIFYDIE